MGLLAPADQDKLRESFAEMTSPVRLLFFTQTLDCETCVHTRQILDELPLLSDKITIEEVPFLLEKEKASQFNVDRVPAIAIVGQDASCDSRDSRIRFLGAPAGYEFISLVQAVLLVGGRGSIFTEGKPQRLPAGAPPHAPRGFPPPPRPPP